MTLTLPTRPDGPGGLAAIAADAVDPLEVLRNAWLAGYRNTNTRSAYGHAIDQWFAWCATNDLHPLQVIRAHVEIYQRHLEQTGRAPRTIAARLNGLASFYTYLIDEHVLAADPMRGVKRPRIERRSPSAWLTRGQLADLITAAERLDRPSERAAVFVLVFNGLRVGELCSLDIDSLLWEGHSPVLAFTRKGGKAGRASSPRATRSRTYLNTNFST